MTVGERIKVLRKETGKTQNVFAQLVGISQTHLRKVELGQAGITVDHLQLICDYLGITMKDFFDYESEPDELSDAISRLTPKQKHLLLDFLKSL